MRAPFVARKGQGFLANWGLFGGYCYEPSFATIIKRCVRDVVNESVDRRCIRGFGSQIRDGVVSRACGQAL